MDKLNVELISKLKNNVTRKLNRQDDIIDIRNFYGVFVPGDDNKFMLCKEVGIEEPDLREFFTGEIIDYSQVIFYKTVCSWRESGKHYSINLNGMYFCLPLVNLLGKNHKGGKVNNKDLAYLYSVVNEYVKKNPEFIDKLIENEKIR